MWPDRSETTGLDAFQPGSDSGAGCRLLLRCPPGHVDGFRALTGVAVGEHELGGEQFMERFVQALAACRGPLPQPIGWVAE